MAKATDKIVAIGDIHGCARTLEALLTQLEDYDDRTFVFVGDYIDRGPDSKGVVDHLLEFSKDRECVMLRGNHEEMMLEAQESGDVRLWRQNGGQATLNSYGAPFNKLELPSQHHHFYRNTELYFDSPDYFFVHAGLPPDVTIEEAKADEEMHDSFLWSRSHIEAPETVWEKTVVFGHTPKPDPIIRDRMIGIDTGCVYSSYPAYSKLTAVLLPEEEFIFQQCLDEL